MLGFGRKPRDEVITRRAVNAAIRERLRGRPGFFGFGTGREEKEAIIKGAITDVTLGRLRELLTLVTYEMGVAHGFIEDEVRSRALLEKQGKIVLGFHAVGVGYDPLDPERPSPLSDPISEGAAKVADAACYRAIMVGTFDNDSTVGDLRYLLGFSRDGSEIRKDA